MNDKILGIIEKDNSVTEEQIAIMLGTDSEDIKQRIKQMKQDKVFLGHIPIINWEKTDCGVLTALIELKVTPQRGEGFDKVAERIYQYPQVRTVYLMSGGFDLMVIVEGADMKEIAFFVAEKLAPMEAVLSTATHFVLKKYKQEGVIFETDNKDQRQVITL